jgi:hypothetical protein
MAAIFTFSKSSIRSLANVGVHLCLVKPANNAQGLMVGDGYLQIYFGASLKFICSFSSNFPGLMLMNSGKTLFAQIM